MERSVEAWGPALACVRWHDMRMSEMTKIITDWTQLLCPSWPLFFSLLHSARWPPLSLSLSCWPVWSQDQPAAWDQRGWKASDEWERKEKRDERCTSKTVGRKMRKTSLLLSKKSLSPSFSFSFFSVRYKGCQLLQGWLSSSVCTRKKNIRRGKEEKLFRILQCFMWVVSP